MSGNTYGHIFKVTTFGESHSAALGCVVDGCPSKIPFSLEMVQQFLNRRRPGQNEYTTSRNEQDHVELLSGVENGLTLGTPISFLIRNHDTRPQDYSEAKNILRPSHADFTIMSKFGIRSESGGGRSSNRETVARVAAASVAQQMLNYFFPDIAVVAYVSRMANVESHVSEFSLTLNQVENSILRCPDPVADLKMQELLKQLKTKGDTVGGLVRCIVRNVPVGLGEPVFDKFEAELAKAMLSLPASKSFEIGSGLAGTFLKGSEHNDPFEKTEDGKVTTRTNNSGGVQGGISNGMPVTFAVGFKPVSTIFKTQDSLDAESFEPKKLTITKGRHDPCVLPRAVPIVEAMTWLVLADLFLRQSINKISREQ